MTRKLRIRPLLVSLGFVLTVSSLLAGAWALEGAGEAARSSILGGAQAVDQVDHDVSPPLAEIAVPAAPRARHEIPIRHFLPPPGPGGPDSVLQLSIVPRLGITRGRDIEGLGQGAYGFTVDAAPPDPNGAAGETQYVQWINESYAVFDKATGALLMGPVVGNSLWAGMNNGCATNNDGDSIVLYDKAAGRWVMTQFSVSTSPYLQCVAVSDTSDATGTFQRYAFPVGPNFPDYSKLGVWADAYYVSSNMFEGNSFVGAKVCALDRDAMLRGLAATSVCFQLPANVASLLPSDLDGSTPPPAGAPDYYLNFSGGALNLYEFHTDFMNPANATFAGPTAISVAPFSPACNGGACIPQAETRQLLDSLGDRLMYRLAYRNFGDHESLVANHSVTVGSSRVGVRWYEIRDPGGAPAVFQQGTFSPDASFRWMGSIAMDKHGDIALGYSVSSAKIHPKIAYTGRTPNDPPGTMESESTVIAGGGSQTRGLNRWGDYTSMTIDPSDDCTFYYTNEYLQSNGSFNWRTRIVSFKFPGCI